MKKDYVEIRGVRAHGFHGLFESERQVGQEFVVDVKLYLSLREAGLHDMVELSVNYADVAGEVEKIIIGKPFQLIETLAEAIATRCLNFENVEAVRVKVHKPHAPIAVAFDDVAVSIYRKQS